MEAILRADNLCKIYGDGDQKTTAIDQINLCVTQGEVIALTGPSGCGKSTLLNLLGLVVRPTAGRIILHSEDCSKASAHELADYRNRVFGYIVQDYALIEKYTVRENIEIPLLYSHKRYSKRARKEMIHDVLVKVDLVDKSQSLVSQLSGGQRQRVAIARALVNNPDIILADEPTGSLDSKNTEEIFSLLLGLVGEGKTLLIATHNQELAARCCIEIRLSDGKIQYD